MKLNFFKKTIQEDFVVIDSQFPQKEPFAFRNSEINEYINTISNFAAYTMYPMHADEKAGFGHSYGLEEADFNENSKGYLAHYPKNKSSIHYLDKECRYKIKLAYSFFLAETYTLLPFYEKNKIPFVFVLYPGGLFGLDSKESDYMLGKLFKSKYFRGVVVTQELTKNYLIQKKLCLEKNIHYIYGGFVQFKPADVKPKVLYKKNKKTLDICFVAAKYSEKGVDKGYDLFIETAKLLCKSTDDIMFHVVGGFDANDINIEEIKNRITFYGYKKPDFLIDFYAKMDIFLSPNRPFKLYGGNFDGFPLGIDAGYCGVALFVSDELQMNKFYTNSKDIVIIPLKSQQIAKKILEYYNNPDKLYKLTDMGMKTTQRLFDIEKQIEERTKVFSKFTRIIPTNKTKEL